ncbi:coiled-coil domain-containing protein 80 [Alosa pseudoharengus]|uniref:coiled-coil domain-containing protein 80 n=1 Tax=Alosa pseudoharengus TaxID=34774 RepID=UPI003F88CF33
MPGVYLLLALIAFWIHSTVLADSEALKGRRSNSRDGSSGSSGSFHQVNPRVDRSGERNGGLAPELDFLAEFAGKHRLWVITAPSHTDNYLLMMEKQIQDMEPEGLNCRLAERNTLVVTIIQNAMMEGKLRRISTQGDVTEESLDSDMVTKLLHYLQIEDQTFSMLILKKNLKVGERFPYPVRVAAILEVIDQLPARKLEKVARKASTEKCKIIKKRLVAKKPTAVRRRVFSPQRQGNVATVNANQRKPVDKKVALRSKIQDILNGHSRYVIRQAPAEPKGADSPLPYTSDAKDNQRGTGSRNGKRKGSKHEAATDVEEAKDGGKTSDQTAGDQKNEESKSKKKRKGKKDRKKKGKRGGKRSGKDAHQTEGGILKDFLQKFQGKRRLMIISAPSNVEAPYEKQKELNEQHQCALAMRKVSMLSILGSESNAILNLQHYQLDSETPLEAQPDRMADPDLIAQMLKEYGVTTKEFSMVVTDYDLKPKRSFKKPAAAADLSQLIDTFPSRQPEKEQERGAPSTCSGSSAAQNSLLRFMSKRRLLIISAPSEDDYSYQQQLLAMRGQECPMGIRHFAMLKLIGSGQTASGTVELFPLNGKSQTEKEPLSQDVVNGLRDQLKINKDYFSMVVVGKDSDVKAWFPSPMWSLANIHDLVDSMELRQQEEKLQRTLGIHCPEDGGATDHGYDTGGADSYLYHRPEE